MTDESNRSDVLANMLANPVEYRGERVVTLRQVDEVHGMAEGTAQRGFGRHRHELQEGVHFHRDGQSVRLGDGRLAGSEPGILLTERGYLWLATTFRGPLAARVRDRLVEAYFAIRAAATGGASDRMLERVLSLAESIQAGRAEDRAERIEMRREMSALAAYVKDSTGPYIGPDRAALVNGALTEWAKAQAKTKGQPDEWARFRRAEENQIRKILDFSGPGTSWSRFSRADWPRLEREVVRLKTEADRLSPQISMELNS